MSGEVLVGASEVAKIVGVNPKTILRMCQSETIPFYDLDPGYRFSMKEIQAWLRDRRRGPQVKA